MYDAQNVSVPSGAQMRMANRRRRLALSSPLLAFLIEYQVLMFNNHTLIH